MHTRTPLSIEVSKALKLLSYTLLSIFIVSSFYFFIKMSLRGEKGYVLGENQLRQKNLEIENKILKQRLLDAESLAELKESKVIKEMTEPEKSLYVENKRPLTKKR